MLHFILTRQPRRCWQIRRSDALLTCHRTTLRELLQNAADASASKVTIKFETSPSISVAAPGVMDQSSVLKHTLLHHTLHRLVVTNNGQPFAPTDWSRLKRIAEGNPDETKIGAFGVGFYSVFADCEEPLVSSGQEAMAFYWKGNSLFTRRLQLPQAQQETSFVLDYRSKTSPVPQLLPLCQFLATSLTFVGLQEIELFLDDWKLLSLAKKAAPSITVALPTDVDLKSRDDLMKVHGVGRETVQMDAKWMEVVRWRPPPSLSKVFDTAATEFRGGSNSAPSFRGFFSRLTGNNNNASSTSLREEKTVQKPVPEDLSAFSTATIFLRVTTANVRVSVTSSFSQEIERATKKRPPQNIKVAILSGALPAVDSVDIFTNVLPNKSGRVFIGFPTQQTTGITGVHISAHSVIPTVEREAIDLNARYVRTWNVEVLRVAGIVCRVAWASELDDIKAKSSSAGAATGNAKARKAEIEKVLPEAIHVFRQFTFKDSTPSAQVGQIVEEAFWTSNKQASIDVFSTQGVLPSHRVRFATEDLSGFVDGIPVLPEALLEDAPEFTDKLREYGLVTPITIADVKRELETKSLDGKQLAEFLKWAARQAFGQEVPRSTTQSLLEVAVATVDGTVIVLGDVGYFIVASRLPADVPVPPNTLPFAFTKNLSKSELEALGWEELHIVPWLRYLVENSGAQSNVADGKDLTRSAAFAGQVLSIISKQWESLSQSSKGTVVSLLEDRTVIPTKMGMKRPLESYFPSVKLFQDLPIASGLHGVKDKLLVALGVRKTVELSVVFDRLMSDPQTSTVAGAESGSKWSHVDLIRYLASVRDDIPADDIKKLRNTAICPAEKDHDPSSPSSQRYKFSNLYAPSEAVRGLHLPILQWPGVYRSGSSEGKFLNHLGLRTAPGVPELVDIMAKAPRSGDLALRDRALTYFIANHHINGYARFPNLSGVAQAYLPLQGEEATRLVRPAECFTNERAAILGFPILRRDLHPHASKFGVTPDPRMADCVDRLLKIPPKNRGEAVLVFAYFAGRLHELGQGSVERLGVAALVPISIKTRHLNGQAPSVGGGHGIRHASPRLCFLGDSADLKEIFDFVDFGSEANAFLLKCGAKYEPTKVQLATMLVQEPARLSSVLQSTEKYLSILRSLAENMSTLKKDRALWSAMKRAPFLLAYREIPAGEKDIRTLDGETDELDDEEESGIKEWSLASAHQTVLVDDFISYNLFAKSLKVAPQEEKLEDFYYGLGSSLLSSIVEEEPRISAVVPDQRSAARLQKLVYERSRLFLHDHASDAIKHDTRWLEKHLTVQAVRSISLRRALRGHNLSHTETRTAAVTHDQRRGWTLWITAAEYDLFQVSQALVHLLLARPKPHSTMMLEMLLSTDLLKLKTRGYNVDRILRAKAAEARIAEDQRQKQMEDERKKLREQEEAWSKAQAQGQAQTQMQPQKQERPHTPSGNGQLSIPGAFADSPEDEVRGNAVAPPQGKKPRGLFSSLTRHLGLDEGRTSEQLQNMLGNMPRPDGTPHNQPPPPYSTEDSRPTRQIEQKAHKPDPVTAPFRSKQNLISAINASRAHDSSNLYSRPETSNVKETGSYCDERPGHDISFVADTSAGIKIFLSNSLTDKSGFLAKHSAGLNLFAGLLTDCGQVFALPGGTLHIYYDESGSTIAFNRQGSLFCNFRFFEQLHLKGMQEQSAGKKSEALVYWWVVLCHELAHNLVETHSAEHSYWT